MIHPNRLLAGICDDRCPNPYDTYHVQKISEHSNVRRTAAKRIQEKGSELFLALFIRRAGELLERGVVIGVLDKALDVLVLRLGIVKRAYMDKLPEDVQFSAARSSITIDWGSGVSQTISYFTHVDICLKPFESKELKFNAFLVRPQST